MMVVSMMALLLVVLLLLLDTGQAIFFPADNAKSQGTLLPHDPHVQVGSTLVLNCTIIRGNYNSSQLYFEVNKTVISSDYVHIISSKTAQLRLPNMSADDPIQTYKCKWPDSSVKVFPSQVVQVSYPPGAPQNLSCINYNWERMKCTFSPGKQDPVLPTNFLVYYSIEGPNLPESQCSRPLQHACEWIVDNSEHSLRNAAIYFIRVVASSIIGNASSEVLQVIPEDRVKPNKVISLAGEVLSSTAVRLSWKPPSAISIHKVIYSITAQNFPDLVYNLTKTNLSIDSLRPNTAYRFVIKSRPVTRGFWSDTSYKDLKTATDVPAKLPPITKHGFQLSSLRGKPDYVHASFYWQSLDPVLVNGLLYGYTITERIFDEGRTTDSHLQTIKRIFVSPSEKLLMREFELETSKSYSFSVAAESDKGYNESLKEKPVIITPYKAVKPPDKVVALHLNESKILVNWTGVAGAVEYMLFWCYSKLPGTCHETVSWQKYDGDLHQAVLTLENGAFIFAVSVELSNGSVSGMSSWTRCTYIYDTASVAPSDFHLYDYQEGESLTVEWTPFRCTQHLYVIYYIVGFCPSQNGHCTDEADNVTVDGSLSKYKIQDLEADREYTAWMFTVAASGISNQSATIYGVVSYSGMRTSTIVGITFGVLCASILLAFGIYAISMRIRKIMAPHEIKITVPERIDIRQIQAVHMENDYGDEDDFGELATPNSMTELILSPLHGQRYKSPGSPNMNNFQQNGISLKSKSSMASTHDSLSSTNTMLSRLDSETESEDDVFITEKRRKISESDRTYLQTVPEEQSTPGQQRKKPTPAHTTVPNNSDEEYHKLAINDFITYSLQTDSNEGACGFSHHVYQQDIVAEDSSPCSYALIQGGSRSATPPCALNLNNSNSYLEIIPDPNSSETLDVKESDIKLNQDLSELSTSDEKDQQTSHTDEQVSKSDDSGYLCNYSQIARSTDSVNDVTFSETSEQGSFPTEENAADSNPLNYIEVSPDSGETRSFDSGLVKSSQCEKFTSQGDTVSIEDGCQNSAEFSDTSAQNNSAMGSQSGYMSGDEMLLQNHEASKPRKKKENETSASNSSLGTGVTDYVCLSDVMNEKEISGVEEGQNMKTEHFAGSFQPDFSTSAPSVTVPQSLVPGHESEPDSTFASSEPLPPTSNSLVTETDEQNAVSYENKEHSVSLLENLSCSC